MATAYKPYHLDLLRTELSRDEDRRVFPYKDSVGKLTVGVGWNIEDKGLPGEVIDRLLDIGIEEAEQALDKIEPRWRVLKPIHQRVLLNMAFNLGEKKFRAFAKMWTAVANYITTGSPDWAREWAKEAKDSRWYVQVGARADRLLQMIETNA
jgi:lysozyme